MLKLVKYIVVLCSFLLFVIAGVVAYVCVTFNPNDYKPQIEKIASDAIGKKFLIKGDITLAVSLIPSININDVVVENSDWATEKNFVSVKQATVSFEILPLLHKQIKISSINIVAPIFSLEVATNGHKNWETNSKPVTESDDIVVKDKKTPNYFNEIHLAEAKISDGIIMYSDKQSDTDYLLKINKISLDSFDMQSDINLQFDIQYLQYPITGTIKSGSLEKILQKNIPSSLNADLNVGKMAVNFTGNVSDISDNIKISGNLNVDNPNKNFNLPAMNLSSAINASSQMIMADIDNFTIAGNILNGKVVANLNKKLPNISIILQTKLLNLSTMFVAKNNDNSLKNIFVNALISNASAQILPEKLASENIPYELLKLFNAEADIKIDKMIISKDFDIDGIRGKIKLNSGILKIDPLTFNFADGSIICNTEINANNKRISANISSKNVLLQEIFDSLKPKNKGNLSFLDGGNTDIEIKISSSGNSYGELIKNLNGQMITIVNKSKIQTKDLKFLSSNVVSQIFQSLNVYKPKDTMTLNCAVLRTDIKNGIATFPNGIAIDTKDLTIVGNGTINLSNENINMYVKPNSRKITETNISNALSSLLKVQGTISDPKVVLDDVGAIKTLVGVITTGPVMLGSQALLDGDDSPCYTALIGTPFSAKFPKATGVKATGQQIYSTASDAIDNLTGVATGAVKGIGKNLMNMFSSKSKKSGKK